MAPCRGVEPLPLVEEVTIRNYITLYYCTLPIIRTQNKSATYPTRMDIHLYNFSLRLPLSSFIGIHHNEVVPLCGYNIDLAA
jgi:hypothetical protein